MPLTTAERLAALEADNADLRGRLAAVEGAKAVPPPPMSLSALPQRFTIGMPEGHRDPSVTIVYPRPGPLPTAGELLGLRRIVGAAFPSLAHPLSDHAEERALRSFGNAFKAASRLRRTGTLDHAHYLSWWLDYARSEAVMEPGTSDGEYGEGDLWAALLAHGVPYRAWSRSSAVEFGLAPVGAGAPMGDLWRGVLARGKINPPAAGVHDYPDSRVGQWAGPT